MIETLFLALAAFVAFLAAHWLWFHYLRPRRRWAAVTRIFLFFLALYAVALWFLPFSHWLVGAGLYVFLFLSYAQFYFLIDRGVSARILVEVLRAGRPLSHDEIRARYSADALQTRRLDDMLYGRYLVLENGVYQLTLKGKLHAVIFDVSKRYVHLNPGG